MAAKAPMRLVVLDDVIRLLGRTGLPGKPRPAKGAVTMTDLDRRAFMKGCAAASLVGLLPQDGLAAPVAPALAIAHAKASPTDPAAIADEARRLTRGAIDAIGGMRRFVSRGDVVMVKPNIGWDRSPEHAADTNPDVVATVVTLCLEAGAKKVLVTDNTCHPAQRAFTNSGIQPAVEKAGGDAFYVDARKFRSMPVKGKVLTDWEVYAQAVEVDKLINVPIVKHHGLAGVTLGMKNLMGVIGGSRGRLHQDLANTLTDLLAFFKPTLLVIDGVRILTANGPTGGSLADVQRKDTIIASADPVAGDAAAATLFGIKPQQVACIVEAAARGLGKIDFESLSPKRLEL
jgi:uncharacterized protein (DUF362 family)